jgi:hypothetical protein
MYKLNPIRFRAKFKLQNIQRIEEQVKLYCMKTV